MILGAGGSLLFAGGAMAADPMPIVVSTVPTVVIQEPTREIMIDFAAETYFGLGDGFRLSTGIGGVIDVTSASGWGLRFEGASFAQIFPPFYAQTSGLLTLYRAFGDLDIGVWAGAAANSMPNAAVGVGLSANYWHEGERLYAWSQTLLQLFPSIGLNSYTELEFDLTDRLTLSSYFEYYGSGFDGGIGFDVAVTDRLDAWSNLYYGGGGLNGLDLGTELAVTERFSVWAVAEVNFTPIEFDELNVGMTFEVNDQLKIRNELSIEVAPFAFGYIDVWMELDRPLGTGALSLTAELGAGFEQGYGAYVWGNVGLRYKLGVPEDHDDNRLFGDDGS